MPEIVVVKPKKNKGSKATVVIKQKPAKKKGGRKKSALALGGPKAKISQFFVNAMLYPDLMGPVRVPIQGCIDRTLLGVDKTKYVFTGSGTNIVQGAILNSSFSGAAFNTYAVTTEAAVFSTPTAQSTGSQFPNINNVADVRLIGMSIIGYYTGTALNAVGEVLVGCVPVSNSGITGIGTANYTSLYYLQDSVHLPVYKTVDYPIRVAGYHEDPESWSFSPTNIVLNGVRVPFIFISGLGTGTTFTIEVCRTWEYRSAVSASNSVPYQESGLGRDVDDSAFTNAMNRLANLPNMVSEALPDAVSSFATTVIDQLPSLVSSSATLVAQTMAKSMLASTFSGRQHTRLML